VFGPLLFVAGAVGGLISLAFLLGILIVEPLAFFIVLGLAFLSWQWAGRPPRRGRDRTRPGWFTPLDPPTYDDDEDF
jgi:hypothetical protein